MTYYKLISGTTFVGVATQHDFRVFQQKHQIILACDEEVAQYVQSADKLYRANWMVPVTTDKISYETVEVIKIDEEEYNILLDAVETGKEIEIEQTPDLPTVDEPVLDPNEGVTLEYIKASKIAEMNYACNKVIVNGVDVTLSDGNTYHFALTTQDQLNLITLSSMVAAGQTMIPYHADGELCRYYSVEDITLVMDTATAHKTYHVTYFNSLKVYIESLEDIAEISAISYGVAIPEEYQSDILKAILVSVNGGESDEKAD